MDWMQDLQNWLVSNGANFAVNLLVFVLILLAAKIVIGALVRVARAAAD